MQTPSMKSTLAHATAIAIREQVAEISARPTLELREDGSAVVTQSPELFIKVYYNRDNVNEVVLFEAPEPGVVAWAIMAITFTDMMADFAIAHIAQLLVAE